MTGSRYFLVNKHWEVIFKEVYIYCDTGTIFKQKGPSSKKKELHMNLIQILFKENIKILIKTLPVSIYPAKPTKPT